MEIWIGVTDASLTDSQTKDKATQRRIKYKSGALVTQLRLMEIKQKGKAEKNSRDLKFFFVNFERCTYECILIITYFRLTSLDDGDGGGTTAFEQSAFSAERQNCKTVLG